MEITAITAKYSIKTVFGEEIKAGDEIMYIYMRYGSYITCFGTVIKIDVVIGTYHPTPAPRLHVHKTYEIGQEKKECDNKVILTNPHVFKCGQEIKNPRKE